ncbi:MAG: hypothetical protein AB8B56_05445 [Crocinitomicaceae bacterium]
MHRVLIFANSFFLLVAILFIQSCSPLYDLRTKSIQKEGITEENTAKGKQVLDKAWKKHGGDKFEQHTTYSFKANDIWKDNKFGKLGKIWPDFETNMEFKFQVDALNGKVEFFDGQKKGVAVGFYDSKYYELDSVSLSTPDYSVEPHIRFAFGLSHIQYFFDILDRLRHASIISYAGEAEFNGTRYDKVFCTMGNNPEPNLENEQYMVWINQATGFMDYIEYSVRDPYVKPIGYKRFGGNLRYKDYREIDGVWIAHSQAVYPIKIREDEEKYIHRLTISEFQFDNFDAEELHPKGLK